MTTSDPRAELEPTANRSTVTGPKFGIGRATTPAGTPK